MNRNNKIFQIIFSILILGIAFLLLLCIGICPPKTVVRPAVVDAEGHLVSLPDVLECALPADTSSIEYTGYTLSPVKNPGMTRPPDDYNKQLQSYIYYSKAAEQKADLFPLVAAIELFGLSIVMLRNLVYIIERPPRH